MHINELALRWSFSPTLALAGFGCKACLPQNGAIFSDWFQRVMTVTVSILGVGQRGRFWAALATRMGHRVSVFDPDAAALATIPAVHASGKISDCVRNADFILDCAPERLALKQKLLQQVQAVCQRHAVIISTSPVYHALDLQNCATRPAQILVARRQAPETIWLDHSDATAPAVVADVDRFLESMGLATQAMPQSISTLPSSSERAM